MSPSRRFLLFCLALIPGCCLAQQAAKGSLLPYVKPIIGTQRMGHTYPGATVPFGMVQLSPETDTLSYELDGKYNPDVYKYCAGYQYDDKTIVGFSHTHFSGTGHSDLGDFLIMPTTGPLRLNPGVAGMPGSGYRSRFSHDKEIAEANYYKAELEDYGIRAELTTTTRVGMHRYTFPAADSAHLILDLMSGIYNYDRKNIWTVLRVVNDTLVTGYRQTSGWARDRTLYFAMVFSRPFTGYGCRNYAEKQAYRGFWGKFDQTRNFPDLAGKQLRAYFNFATKAGDELKIKFALSPVSMDGALGNLVAEAPGWDFDAIKRRGQEAWEKELHKIEITADEEVKVNFYTAMYHAFINPTVYMDVDGRYKGLDREVHTANGFTNYTTFSLWDTYRALHPLFNILQPKRNSDMIRSMLAHYDQSAVHMLPVWSNSANENWCMTGYHAVAAIADAAVKNIGGFDAGRALDACIRTANNERYPGVAVYRAQGYIPSDPTRSAVDYSGTAVSTTLEYAYDDWAIAQLAKKLNRTQDYETFLARSRNYRNVFDKTSGFMRPRMMDGTFRKDFDPLSTEHQGFIEGNSWNYSLFVPQDPEGLKSLMGGDRAFIRYLDTLFTMHLPDAFFAETEDITRDGIIGGYVHGNEPSHHVAYLYNWTSQPWKTQERVRMILKNQYHSGPDGLGGNDDAGQMSAWYIFSTLGFYPVAPGSDSYQIGSPAVRAAVLHLENGKTFRIEARNQSDANVYISGMALNGKPLRRWSLTHRELMNGGTLVYYLSPTHP